MTSKEAYQFVSHAMSENNMGVTAFPALVFRRSRLSLTTRRPLKHAVGSHTHRMEAVRMILSAAPAHDKADPFASLPPDLLDYARQAIQHGTSFDDFERRLLQRVFALAKTTTDFFLKNQGNGNLGPTVTTENNTILQRSEKPLRRRLQDPLRLAFLRVLRRLTRPEADDQTATD
jgi:hypothetical protein